jgi:hypothetical protein
LLVREGDIPDSAIGDQAGAVAWAEMQVTAARDDPAARLALLLRTYHGPTGRAPRPPHMPLAGRVLERVTRAR